MFPEALLSSLVSLGGAALLIWWLRSENLRLLDVIEKKDDQLKEKCRKIVQLYDEKGQDRREFSETVKTISDSLCSISRGVSRNRDSGR